MGVLDRQLVRNIHCFRASNAAVDVIVQVHINVGTKICGNNAESSKGKRGVVDGGKGRGPGALDAAGNGRLDRGVHTRNGSIGGRGAVGDGSKGGVNGALGKTGTECGSGDGLGVVGRIAVGQDGNVNTGCAGCQSHCETRNEQRKGRRTGNGANQLLHRPEETVGQTQVTRLGNKAVGDRGNDIEPTRDKASHCRELSSNC